MLAVAGNFSKNAGGERVKGLWGHAVFSYIYVFFLKGPSVKSNDRKQVRPHLTHEVRDDPVEDGAVETEALLARAQSPEVLCRFGNDVSEQLHDDSPSRLTIDPHIEVHHRVGVL